jgi:hypothetical protein
VSGRRESRAFLTSLSFARKEFFMRYYRVVFYAGGLFVGEDVYLCHGMSHALRMAEYVKRTFVSSACRELGLPYEPSRAAYGVFGPSVVETARNVGLATCLS